MTRRERTAWLQRPSASGRAPGTPAAGNTRPARKPYLSTEDARKWFEKVAAKGTSYAGRLAKCQRGPFKVLLEHGCIESFEVGTQVVDEDWLTFINLGREAEAEEKANGK